MSSSCCKSLTVRRVWHLNDFLYSSRPRHFLHEAVRIMFESLHEGIEEQSGPSSGDIYRDRNLIKTPTLSCDWCRTGGRIQTSQYEDEGLFTPRCQWKCLTRETTRTSASKGWHRNHQRNSRDCESLGCLLSNYKLAVVVNKTLGFPQHTFGFMFCIQLPVATPHLNLTKYFWSMRTTPVLTWTISWLCYMC